MSSVPNSTQNPTPSPMTPSVPAPAVPTPAAPPGSVAATSAPPAPPATPPAAAPVTTPPVAVVTAPPDLPDDHAALMAEAKEGWPGMTDYRHGAGYIVAFNGQTRQYLQIDHELLRNRMRSHQGTHPATPTPGHLIDATATHPPASHTSIDHPLDKPVPSVSPAPSPKPVPPVPPVTPSPTTPPSAK